jgi:hypothetical protein
MTSPRCSASAARTGRAAIRGFSFDLVAVIIEDLHRLSGRRRTIRRPQEEARLPTS